MTGDIYKALDICDKLDFFYGQRAGRELWFEKPISVQNEDLVNFTRDIQYIKNFINSQNAEINRLRKYDKERDIRLHARLIETARIEATKEFEERLKELYDCGAVISPVHIDNIVKEIIGAYT